MTEPRAPERRPDAPGPIGRIRPWRPAQHVAARSRARSARATRSGFVSAQTLHATLRDENTGIGLATVYRALAGLAAQGDADSLQSPEGESLYRACTTRRSPPPPDLSLVRTDRRDRGDRRRAVGPQDRGRRTASARPSTSSTSSGCARRARRRERASVTRLSPVGRDRRRDAVARCRRRGSRVGIGVLVVAALFLDRRVRPGVLRGIPPDPRAGRPDPRDQRADRVAPVRRARRGALDRRAGLGAAGRDRTMDAAPRVGAPHRCCRCWAWSCRCASAATCRSLAGS